MGTGKVGIGTSIDIGGVIAGVESITGPGFSADMEEITALDSADGWEEYIAGVLRTGEVSLTINWVPATHSGLITTMVARTAVACTITWPAPSGGTTAFNAFVQSVTPSTPGGKMTASVTIKPTGKPTSGIGA